MAHSTSVATPLVLAALIAVQVLFGLNYVISKVVVDAFPPLVWGSIRIIIAAAVLMGVARLSLRKRHPKMGWDFFGPLIVFALLGTIINQGSFLVGLSKTTATNSAILNTLIPVFTLLIVTIRGQEPLTLRKTLGFISALSGVLVLRKFEEFRLSDETVVGDLLMIVNCLSYAFFLAYSKKFLMKHGQLWTTAWLFVCGSVGLTLISLPDWVGFELPELTPTLLACATFAVIGGTLLTYFLNNWALAHVHSSNVALWIYIQPVIAAALAWFWFDEKITTRTVFSAGLIFIGMYLGLSGSTSGRPSKSRKRG